jgi:gas vesicle protein
MNQQHGHDRQRHGRNGFAIGLLTGTFIGAGLAIWFAPRVASELRERVIESANTLGSHAVDRYQDVSRTTGDAVGAITRKARDIRDDVAGVVARGGHEVERVATAAKTV